MQAKLPELFGRCPRRRLKWSQCPTILPRKLRRRPTTSRARPTAAGRDACSSTPTTPPDRNLYGVESIAYHEGIPGHHLQISIAQELTGLPEFRKFEGYTAYTEGWGLYAERLGKDVGFYQDPYSDYGRLENDIWRAIRLVVDTGVHSEGWTRDQMVAVLPRPLQY